MMLPASERASVIIGAALLACPVTDPGVQQVKVLLPGSDEVNCSIKCQSWRFTCTYHTTDES